MEEKKLVNKTHKKSFLLFAGKAEMKGEKRQRKWWKATQINLFQSICQALVLLFCYLDWMFMCSPLDSVSLAPKSRIYLYNQFLETVRTFLINVFVLRQYWLNHDILYYLGKINLCGLGSFYGVNIVYIRSSAIFYDVVDTHGENWIKN